MAKILAPNNQYTGTSAGVSFVNGIGETKDPYLIDWFAKHKYTVELGERKPTKKVTEKKAGE